MAWPSVQNSLGDIALDIALDGVGPIASDGGHATTDFGNVRLIEVWQGKARSAVLSGSVTVTGRTGSSNFRGRPGGFLVELRTNSPG
mgnify:CR=1 FL=1